MYKIWIRDVIKDEYFCVNTYNVLRMYKPHSFFIATRDLSTFD